MRTGTIWVLVLLGVLGTLGTLTFAWAYLAVGSSDPWDVSPTESEERRAALFLLVTLCCGLVVPWVGALVSTAARRWAPAILFTFLASLLLVAAIRIGVPSHAMLRETWYTFVPSPTPTPARTHCVEYSGDGNDCPGG